MTTDPPAVLIFNGTVRLTVDADTAFDHPRCRGQVVDIVTAVELLEMQWRKRNQGTEAPRRQALSVPPHPSSFTLHP